MLKKGDRVKVTGPTGATFFGEFVETFEDEMNKGVIIHAFVDDFDGYSEVNNTMVTIEKE